MASLNKLAIRGIRSFDDKQISVIEFFSPVTVIVGHNGSGKTTIIECLKYATTGDQPPNTRGGAFVHDPKMANEKEVKAQVKLRFQTATGRKMLAVRNLSVTVKKTAGLTMKTLESILAVENGDDMSKKRAVISTKCAEMDAEIPQLLGVSKSVLENVIFCHQEDSHWPLSEPSILKKKFDDIFEATKYTKALDSIKSLRKDRMADLKAERERLEGLSREKSHADKLRDRMTELNQSITAKEVEYEETKALYEKTVQENQQLYDMSARFHEIILKYESLNQRREDLARDAEELRRDTREEPGTLEALTERLQQHDQRITQLKDQRRAETYCLEDTQDNLAGARQRHTAEVKRHGELKAEANALARSVQEREQLIREICAEHGIEGFGYSPLERDKIIEFVSRHTDVQRRLKQELDDRQSSLRSKTEKYNQLLHEHESKLQGYKLQRDTLREQTTERQRSIMESEQRLDRLESVSSEIKGQESELQSYNTRFETLRKEMDSANYEQRIGAKTNRGRELEDRRTALMNDMTALNAQASTRAKLDLKRTEVKTKRAELETTLATAGDRFRRLVGTELNANTMEGDVERARLKKEQTQTDLEGELNAANAAVQRVEASIRSDESQLDEKRSELKKADRHLKKLLDGVAESLDQAISDANEEMELRQRELEAGTTSSKVYQQLLKQGKKHGVCPTCNRGMNEQDLIVFEKFLKDQMSKASPERIAQVQEELQEWKEEAQRLRGGKPIEIARDRLRDVEIPALEEQIRKLNEEGLPPVKEDARKIAENLDAVKREIKNFQTLSQHALTISKLQKDISDLTEQISAIEKELMTTGSTKTTDDIQAEMDGITAEIRAADRERQQLTSERDRQAASMRAVENEVHKTEKTLLELQAKLQEKDNLEDRIKGMKEDIVNYGDHIKRLEREIANAQGPINELNTQYRKMEQDLNAKIAEAQEALQACNREVDKVKQLNETIDHYRKSSRLLDECAANVERHEKEIEKFSSTLESIRNMIAQVDKEVNESGASVARLQNNIRLRRMTAEIEEIRREMESLDYKKACESRQTFERDFRPAKQKEMDLQSAYSHLAGELSSQKGQLKTWEGDMKEYKDIHKRYSEQLVKVKMSDMANNDLEKYAKALDNAIMKYHGLKMEEVNDTMRHLWNKTYQGTDIDGIKIRSDVEGGASKRSYNYRVVMTKDQVEMDMRGRCSAGQKMLASIIIRLALSDSFGQNCGILALDEPTNALDTENIDALAASLVDIINERKGHSNFQLIIITHDENFLQKLGQSEVMEYYWRVIRDSRQKSIIERQHFH